MHLTQDYFENNFKIMIQVYS